VKKQEAKAIELQEVHTMHVAKKEEKNGPVHVRAKLLETPNLHVKRAGRCFRLSPG
jgi:hypothetical protein